MKNRSAAFVFLVAVGLIAALSQGGEKRDQVIPGGNLSDPREVVPPKSGPVRTALQMIKEGRQTFRFDIEGALARLQQGTYGICEGDSGDCQKKIPVARLNALPYTRIWLAADVRMRLGYKLKKGARLGVQPSHVSTRVVQRFGGVS